MYIQVNFWFVLVCSLSKKSSWCDKWGKKNGKRSDARLVETGMQVQMNRMLIKKHISGLLALILIPWKCKGMKCNYLFLCSWFPAFWHLFSHYFLLGNGTCGSYGTCYQTDLSKWPSGMHHPFQKNNGFFFFIFVMGQILAFSVPG